MKQQNSNAIEQLLQREVQRGQVMGVQAAVFEQGQETFYYSYGMADQQQNYTMDRHSICRMYSMTKPITAVMAWIFKERGLLNFTDPVAKYLPEYENMQVFQDEQLVPANEAMTIQHLLSMTSGLVYPSPDGGAGIAMGQLFTEIEKAIAREQGYATREVIRKIAGIPLAYHPGQQWQYGLSADVLAAVLEVISGKTMGQLYQEELFTPLEMVDTGFYVPKEKQQRFAQLYEFGEDGKLCVDHKRHLGLTLCLEPPAYESGGAGLVSTLDDYGHFVHMLLAGGVYKDKRILSQETVEMFTRNVLTREQIKDNYFAQLKGFGYANLMRVNLGMGESASAESKGEFGWDGWAGTYFAVDPSNKKALLVLMQISEFQHWNFIWKLRNEIWK